MNKLQLIIIGAITAIVLLIGGVFIGKYYFSKTDIKVVDRIVYKTEYKTKIVKEYTTENFDQLWGCYQSPITFADRTEQSYLYVTAKDDCKEATARYQIGTKGNYKIYLGIAGAAAITGGILSYKYLRK